MNSRAAALSISGAIFALDRVSKALVEAYVARWDAFVVIPGIFNIIHTQNRGAAFGFLADAGGTWRTFLLVGVSSIVLLFVGALLWRATRRGAEESWLSRSALAMILGGAVGNVYDRVTKGMVTDFLDFYAGSYHWHTFNVADSAITIGASLLLIEMWRQRNEGDRRCNRHVA
ncbi:MAG: signal peptidase II [Bryobacteraceae bacterium]|nr:signal peptidase II [Bryobacterales bacterium]MEB2362371.1 signal peptidase II [Bryobacterales bacterium]NUN00320.1 signal peptidase II [Bryobacteraceae bacterium]